MSPSELVARYRALPFPSGELGDCAENYLKCQILSALGQYANEPEVLQLLLDILSERGELDLARMDAAKIVALEIDGRSPLERQLKDQLWCIAANVADNQLVRQQVAQCLQFGFGGKDEARIVEQVLFDDHDDVDVRFGLLHYLADPRAAALAKELLPRLREHWYWSQFEAALDAITAKH